MEKDLLYIKGIWINKFNFTKKTINQLIGIDFKNELDEVIGHVVSVSLKGKEVHYIVKRKVDDA